MPSALSAAIVPLTDFWVAVDAAMAATRTTEALLARWALLLLPRRALAGCCRRGCCGRAAMATMCFLPAAVTAPLARERVARAMVRRSL